MKKLLLLFLLLFGCIKQLPHVKYEDEVVISFGGCDIANIMYLDNYGEFNERSVMLPLTLKYHKFYANNISASAIYLTNLSETISIKVFYKGCLIGEDTEIGNMAIFRVDKRYYKVDDVIKGAKK